VVGAMLVAGGLVILGLAPTKAAREDRDAKGDGDAGPRAEQPIHPVPALARSAAPTAIAAPKPRPDYVAAKGAISDCWSSKRCPPAMTCWLGDDERLGCYSSNCSTVPGSDVRCGAREVCATIDRRQGIRRCVEAGDVPENGICRGTEFSGPETGCAPGTVCWRSHCHRLCAGATDCDKGSCTRVNDGERICVPSCAGDGDCQGGRKCVGLDPSEARICVHVPSSDGGSGCLPDVDSCPVGQRCDFALADDVLVSTCRPACDERTPCPQESICAAAGNGARQGGVCIAICNPTSRGCAGGESCVVVDAARDVWGCRTVPSADRPGVNVLRTQGHFSDSVADPR
jgi:hypothetical protein